MSEKINFNNHERASNPNERVDQKPETNTNNPERNIHQHEKHIESIRHGIEKQALSVETINQSQEVANNQPAFHQHITKQIKAQTYKKTMSNVQKNLPKWQANFSRLIHQEKIESISEIGAKTIARPSGILAGSLIALMGGVLIVVVANRVGFSITPFVFIVLFIFGYLVGMVAELVFKFLKKINHKTHKSNY
jgi:hypothetical protein